MKKNYFNSKRNKSGINSVWQKSFFALLFLFMTSYAFAQQTATIVTTSNDSFWTASFVNTGGLSLSWQAVGPNGINETGFSDNPNFDFSANVGNGPITITITSNDNFDHTTQVLIPPGREVTSIDISSMHNLQELRLPNNNLTSIDIASNSNLTLINLQGNQLSSIDLSNNSLLEGVYVYDNNLTALDLSSNPNLEIVHAYNNNISSLDVSGALNLTDLDMSSNDLTTLDVSNNTNLSVLDLDFNHLTTNAINQILIDIDNYGTSNGNLNLQGNVGTITAPGIPAMNNLLSRNWTIVPPVVYDFGDAPDSYGTSISASGAQHIVGARDFKIGVVVDSEMDAVSPGVNADGDDNDNVADEDGVAATEFDGIITSTDNHTINVQVTNNYSTAVNLYGWIDFDGNGTFDADEFASTVVPNGGVSNATLNWTNLIANGVDIVEGQTYARFRLTSDVLTGNDPTGIASDGEVEDYGFEILLDTDRDNVPDITDLDDDNDGILDVDEDNGTADRDTNSDGSPDRISLDADGDACFDVVEAGFVDGDNNGMIGTGDETVLVVDANGLVTADANGPIVHGTDAYIPGPQLDADANGVPDFQEAGAAATITTQPTDQDLIIGVVTFSVVVDTGVNNPSYQWQISTDTGVTWTDIVDGGDYAGATTADLAVTHSDVSKLTEMYRVVVGNSGYNCATDIISDEVTYITPDDFDNDGVYDIVDVDDDNDGILDVDEDNGVVDRDTNNDGIPDRISLDADGDGCFDVIEAGNMVDPDGDGMVGISPVIVNPDGSVASDINGPITAYGPVNDLDNNGIPDFQEAGVAASITTQPTDQDLIIGVTTFSVVADDATEYQWQVSTDGGTTWVDIVDGGDYAGATTADLMITHSDVSKLTEIYRVVVSNIAYACDPTDISDEVTYITPDDFDNDGVYDIVDVDDDNDGILDVDEAGNTDPSTNPDRINLDADGDGCYDVTEAGFTDNGVGMLGTSNPPVVDATGRVTSATDGYTTPNDLDNNGIPDFQEAGTAAGITTQPVDQNLIPGNSATFSVVATSATEYQWEESTDNGATWVAIIDGGDYAGATTADLTISNLTLAYVGNMYRVTVSNIAYACDPTTVSDAAEFAQLDDFDNDGVPDIVDVDDDNDGILDVDEAGNTDPSTKEDRINLDADGDGCYDVTEAGFTDNGAGMLGTSNPPVVDATGRVTSATDGYTTPNDLDNNGIPDFQEAGAVASITTQPTDQDYELNSTIQFSVTGSANANGYQWQISTDGVNFTNLSDGGYYSGTNTATLTVTTDNTIGDYGSHYRVIVRNIAFACDPGDTSISATYNIQPDTDGDGVYDIVDLDDDNDGIYDTVEGENTDTDLDGVPDRLSLDADGDMCADVTEAGFDDPDGDGRLGTSPVTVNADGVVVGQGGYTTPNDLDNDGRFDFQQHGAPSEITLQPEDVEIDLTNDATFEINGSATYYQWQESSDKGTTWTDLINSAQYGGVNTPKLTIVDPRFDFEGNLYRVVLSSPDYACDPNPELFSDTGELKFTTVVIPDGISPNGDGSNDVFMIPGLAQSPNFKMKIFDRWGNIVFNYANNGKANPDWWDGNAKGSLILGEGERVPAATYFYLIDYNDGVKSPSKGWVYVNY